MDVDLMFKVKVVVPVKDYMRAIVSTPRSASSVA